MPKSRAAGGRCGHVAAADLDAAFVLRIEAGDGAQQRGLAAARRPEEADELALAARRARCPSSAVNAPKRLDRSRTRRNAGGLVPDCTGRS